MRFFWPELQTRPKAKDAAREGAWMVTGIAVLLFGLTTASLWTEGGIAGITEWTYVDAFLLGAIAFGLFLLSRVAAVAGLVLFVIARLWMGLNQPSYVVTFIILVALVNGVRGTFAYNRLTKAMQQGVVPTRAP